MMTCRKNALIGLLALLTLGTAGAAAASEAVLTRMALRGIELTFNGDYPEAIAAFDEVIAKYPESPAGYFYKGTSYLYWMQRDADLRAPYEPRFMNLMEQAIEQAESIIEEHPDNAKAWFFLGGARGMRAQQNLNMGRYFRASGDARNGKKALERAAELDPAMVDVKFGLGTYNYYVDALPKVVGMLKHLLFIPNGNTELGIEQLWEATHHGVIGKAASLNMLWDIYLHYEMDFDKGIEVGEQMNAWFPRNAWFPYWLGKTYMDARNDLSRAEALFRRSIDVAESRKPDTTPLASRASGYATIRLSQCLDRQLKTVEAIELLERFLQATPTEPVGVQSAAKVELARMRMRRGEEDQAERLFAEVLRGPDIDFDRGASLNVEADKGYRLHKVAGMTEKELEKDNLRGAYVVAAERGWHELHRGNLESAAEAFDEAAATAANDGMVALGRAEVLLASGAHGDALALFELAASSSVAKEWAWVPAAARLGIGKAHDLAGRRSDALASYERVIGEPASRFEDRRTATRLVESPFAFSPRPHERTAPAPAG